MMGFGMMGGGGILGILIIGLVIFFVVKLFNNPNEYNSKKHSYSRNNDALETLKERYARGEISEEEYERKRKILRE